MVSLETIHKYRVHMLRKLILSDLLESSSEASHWKESGVSSLHYGRL